MYARLDPVRWPHRRSCAGVLLVFALVGLVVFITIPRDLLQEAGSARLSQLSLHGDARIPSYLKDGEEKSDPKNVDMSNNLKSEADLLPWYFKNGKRRPEPQSFNENEKQRLIKLWPEEDPGNDRIENQLMFVPERLGGNAQAKMKTIYLSDGFYTWDNVKPGRATFLEDGCPVDTCILTDKKEEATTADAVLFRDYFSSLPGFTRPLNQIWILYTMESPINMKPFFPIDVFNWTTTYRIASDVSIPYGRYVQYADHGVKPRPLREHTSLNRTGKVAWVVSNCNNKNGRLDYARELSKHIDVDIYGGCGKLKCTSKYPDPTCFTTLARKYKFYLSFENSNCLEYITEKFFYNGLGNNMIPVVMGAPPQHYARVSPPHSYIHVDEFDSPRQLAEYLLLLDRDEALYDTYFHWQSSGEVMLNHAYCRLCAVLHDHPDKHFRHYDDINAWWRPPGVCMRPGPWRKWKPDEIK